MRQEQEFLDMLENIHGPDTNASRLVEAAGANDVSALTVTPAHMLPHAVGLA